MVNTGENRPTLPAEVRLAKAIVIDDSPIMRMQLRKLLARAGCEVVGEAASGDELLALYERHLPDLVTLEPERAVAVLRHVQARNGAATTSGVHLTGLVT